MDTRAIPARAAAPARRTRKDPSPREGRDETPDIRRRRRRAGKGTALEAAGGATEPRPFLKWAGGKGQLLAQFLPLYPPLDRVKRYLEPFVGSGAVFFDVRSRLAGIPVHLSDGNEELINAWTVVRDDVEALIGHLRRHRQRHGEERFYEVRALDPARLSPAARAARLIYLNRTCFNGLYRVNSRGDFNVPFGRYADPKILDADNLRAVSAALRGVGLRVRHFRETLSAARPGDFIYFDPPYHPVSATSFFTAYSVQNGRSGFTADDQAELADVARRLAERGCLVMLSNSEAPLVRDLYRGFRIVTVSARRNINSRADRRGAIAEIVALSY